MIFKTQYFIEQVMHKYRKYNQRQTQDVFLKSFDTILESDKEIVRKYITLDINEDIIFLSMFPYFHYLIIPSFLSYIKKIFIPKKSYFFVLILLTTSRIILKLPFCKLRCIDRLNANSQDINSNKSFQDGFLIPVTFFDTEKKVKIKMYIESGQQCVALGYALHFYFHPKFDKLD